VLHGIESNGIVFILGGLEDLLLEARWKFSRVAIESK
jgi:hypothetical protein